MNIGNNEIKENLENNYVYAEILTVWQRCVHLWLKRIYIDLNDRHNTVNPKFKQSGSTERNLTVPSF